MHSVVFIQLMCVSQIYMYKNNYCLSKKNSVYAFGNKVIKYISFFIHKIKSRNKK